jgi:hypothetical protein
MFGLLSEVNKMESTFFSAFAPLFKTQPYAIMKERMVVMVDYITRETLNKYVKGKSIIKLKDFAELFEKEFGIVVPFKEKVDYEKLTDDKKRKLTKAIFSNEEVLEQLRNASTERNYVENDEEAIQIIKEANNGQ